MTCAPFRTSESVAETMRALLAVWEYNKLQ
jgi:hypothetical protein